MGITVTILSLIIRLIGFVFILRAWFYASRIPPFNPFSQTIYRFTDWASLPMQRLIAPRGQFDWPSIIVVWIAAFLYLLTLFNFQLFNPLGQIIAALLTGVEWWLNTMFWAIIIQALLSWINPAAPIAPLLNALTAPILNPIRSRMPSTGAIDFSPLIVLIITQVLIVVINNINRNILFSDLLTF
ncbi:MAG TPA: YggT family protein [Paenalcaligenes sp.]|nr:YggT family protein [Paenalcaligenes sp.]